MHSHFVEDLNKKFSNQFIVETNENESFIRFPAKSFDFGDILVYEDAPGQYIVELGKFTHCHFDIDDGTDDEKPEKAAEYVCDFLEKLFADCIICWGAHEWGGGCFLIEDENEEEIDWTDLYVWSGIHKRAATK